MIAAVVFMVSDVIFAMVRAGYVTIQWPDNGGSPMAFNIYNIPDAET